MADGGEVLADGALPRCVQCKALMRGEYATFGQKSALVIADETQKQWDRVRHSRSSSERAATRDHDPNDGICPRCFRCAECKKEMMGKKFFEEEGQVYCEDCFGGKFAPKCKACARVLWGHFRVHESGELYCVPCELHEPGCCSCGRLCWERRSKYEKTRPMDLPDGRILCEVCAPRAIFSPQAAAECFDQAKRFVHKLLGRQRSFAEHLRAKYDEVAVSGSEMNGIELSLVDRTEMSTLSFEHGCHHMDGKAHLSPLGITLLQKQLYGCNREMTAMGTTRLNIRPSGVAGVLTSRTVTRAVRGICALTGLPPIALTATLVHELLHYHMFVVGNFRQICPIVEEGICELAALLYLRSLPEDFERDVRIRQRLDNPSQVYGQGLRDAEKRWRELGGNREAFQKLLERVRQHQSF